MFVWFITALSYHAVSLQCHDSDQQIHHVVEPVGMRCMLNKVIHMAAIVYFLGNTDLTGDIHSKMGC